VLRVFRKRVGKGVVPELLQAFGDGVGNGIVLGVVGGERRAEKLGDSVELGEQVRVFGGSVAQEIEVEVEGPI